VIRHLLKLAWSRRGSNGLIAAEMLVSFLVLLGVVTLGLFYLDNYRRPIGFEYGNVWRLEVQTPRRVGDRAETGRAETIRQLFAAVRATPGVLAVAGGSPTPFSQSSSNRNYDRQGRRVEYSQAWVTDDFAKVLGIPVVKGRFLSREDDAATWEPVVVTESLARELFGGEDPLGRSISADQTPKGEPEKERRVVGVIAAFRQEGELDPPVHYVFERQRIDTADAALRGDLLVRVAPGATAELEERLVRVAQGVARDWTFRVEPLAVARDRVMRFYLAPVLIVGLLAGFLALMVALGLTGVLWLSVTRRTREIGLRRANGATRGDIRAQVLGEIVILTSLALLPGVILALQLPLLGVLPVPGRVFGASLALSVAGIYLLAVLCGWYPARLATRVEPAEALRYE
jgi:putative ABC transport system permease protein